MDLGLTILRGLSLKALCQTSVLIGRFTAPTPLARASIVPGIRILFQERMDFKKHVYCRACGKHTVTCEDVIKTLGHHDKPLSSQVMPTYFTQPISVQSSASVSQSIPPIMPASSPSHSATCVVTLNGTNLLHVSDLDPTEHDQEHDMFVEDSKEDSFKDIPTLSSFNPSQPSSFQSSIHFGPSQCPLSYQSQHPVSVLLQGFPGYQFVSPQQQTLPLPSFPAFPSSPVFTFSPTPMSGSPRNSPMAPTVAGPSAIAMGK
ncbi:hypothetical protein BGZ79_005612 [Entomortierella chlamydospora]|nr:hypothetical protein BGZ79_005612 [Entomortierella chlamydospora]